MQTIIINSSRIYRHWKGFDSGPGTEPAQLQTNIYLHYCTYAIKNAWYVLTSRADPLSFWCCFQSDKLNGTTLSYSPSYRRPPLRQILVDYKGSIVRPPLQATYKTHREEI